MNDNKSKEQSTLDKIYVGEKPAFQQILLGKLDIHL
jgi:hypothetical protein